MQCALHLCFSGFLGVSPCIPLVSALAVDSAALPGHCSMLGKLLKERRCGDGFLSRLLMQIFISGVQPAGFSHLWTYPHLRIEISAATVISAGLVDIDITET